MLHNLRSLQIQGRLEAAERSFARILSVTPRHIHARIGLSYCAWLSGDRAGAERELNDAARLDPADEDAVVDCAMALGHIGKFTAADAMLARKQQTPSLLMARATLAEQQGDNTAAIHFCEAVLAADEKSGDGAFHKLIALHRRNGHFHAALMVAAALEASGSGKSAIAAHARSLIYAAMGRSEDAVDALHAGLAANPTSELCMLALSREWRRLGRIQEASALVSEWPKTANVLLEQSDLALALRNPELARHYAEEANCLLPKRVDALLKLLRIEIDQRRYEMARAVADRILGKGAEHRAHHLRALLDIARTSENNQEVKTLLTQLVALVPMDAALHVELSRAWRKLGQGAEAAAELALAFDLDPRCVAALTDAGVQAQGDRDYRAARQFLRRVLEIAPDHVGHHIHFLRLLQVTDDDEQNTALKACMERFGDNPELRSDHIRRLREAGRLEEALAEAEAAQAVHPGVFNFWIDCFDLTLRLRPSNVAEVKLTHIHAQNRREETVVALQKALLAIRQHRRGEARRILEEALDCEPLNRSYLNELLNLSLWYNDLQQAMRYHLCLVQIAVPERRLRGETTNGSQSHAGQMVNDMRLDLEAMEALDQSRSGTTRSRICRLIQLVRERPEHIPTAQALIVTVAEAGHFVPPALNATAATANAHIPLRISQYWDKDQVPADLHLISQSWRDLNPLYHYRLFNDTTARAYLKDRLPLAVLQAYLRAEDATTKADLFRLAVLVLDGGIWADMDDRCLEPVAQLFRSEDRAVVWQERTGHICNNFMAAVPDHPIFRRALVSAVKAINRGDHDKVWMLTGPGLITRCFAQEMAVADELWSSWLEQVNVISEFDLWPVVAMHCTAIYKREGRHWHREAFQRKKRERETAASAVMG